MLSDSPLSGTRRTITEEIELTGTSGLVKEETRELFSDLFIQQEEQQDGKVGWVAVGEFEAASVCSPQQLDGLFQEPGQGDRVNTEEDGCSSPGALLEITFIYLVLL